MDNKYKYINNIENFSAGDSLSWNILFDNYKSINGYNLSMVFVNTNTKFQFVLNNNSNGSFDLSLVSADTSVLEAGKYLVFIVLSRVADNFTKQIEHGYLTINASMLNVASFDNRTHAEKVLESINNLLEKKTLDDVKDYEIQGRKLSKYDFFELIKIRDYYKNEVEANIAKKALAEGGVNRKNKLKVVFSPSWKQ